MPTLLAAQPRRPHGARRLFAAGRAGPRVRRACSSPGAHRLQLFVCAAALVPLLPAELRAQQPAPADTTDYERGLPPGADTLRSPAAGAPDRIAVPGDTACVREGFPAEVVCRARVVMADSAKLRALAALAAERMLKHAARMDGMRQAPITWAEYRHNAFGVEAVLRTAALAGWEQLLGHPRGWPRSRWGYALRFSTRFASEAAVGAVRFEVASRIRAREAPYVPCACQGTGARILHALVAPFRTVGPDGERYSPLTPVTELGGGMVLATVGWGGVHPRQGLVAGLNGLLSLSLAATLREFRPWELWKAN